MFDIKFAFPLKSICSLLLKISESAKRDNIAFVLPFSTCPVPHKDQHFVKLGGTRQNWFSFYANLHLKINNKWNLSHKFFLEFVMTNLE